MQKNNLQQDGKGRHAVRHNNMSKAKFQKGAKYNSVIIKIYAVVVKTYL
jgi:hypothetical protein